MAKNLIAVVVVLLSAVAYAEDSLQSNALKASQTFWDGFSQYESKLAKDLEAQNKKSLQALKEQESKDLEKQRQQEMAFLLDAAKEYQSYLDKFKEASNRSLVMLKFSQTLHALMLLQKKQDESFGQKAFEKGVALLETIEKQDPNFKEMDQLLYTKAIFFESQNLKEQAQNCWKKLGMIEEPSLTKLHGLLALGDFEFEKDNADKALTYYDKALRISEALKVIPKDKIRILYRLLWSVHRLGDLKRVESFAINLLSFLSHSPSLEMKNQIREDATDLWADALLESNKISHMKASLSQTETKEIASSLGSKVATRLFASDLFSETKEFANFMINQLGVFRELPTVFNLLAQSHLKTHEVEAGMMAYEKMLLLLPQESLWAKKFPLNDNDQKSFLILLLQAAERAAEWRYDMGLKTQNPQYYLTAASHYKLLLKTFPLHEKTAQWRIKVGHGYLFAEDEEEALMYYGRARDQSIATPEIIKTASYQMVMAAEKKWRKAFVKTLEKGLFVKDDFELLSKLKDLLQRIEEYSDRYKNESPSIDLMLVGASASRDQEQYDLAHQMWEKVLSAQTSVHQRSLAIRGIIFTNLKDGAPQESFNAMASFLRLEDWKRTGDALKKEILSLYDQALAKEAKRLAESGDMKNSGILLVRTASEFKELPNARQYLRDGAYYLAIVGEWVMAQDVAEEFLKSTKNTKFFDDMRYLLARGYEYQMRFEDAAQAYFDLGKKFPKHSKAKASLLKAEKLALAEDRFDLAAESASLLATRVKEPDVKLMHFKKAIEHAMKAKSFALATSLAQKRVQASKTFVDQIESRLLLCKTYELTEDVKKSQESLLALNVAMEQRKDDLGAEHYARLMGESQYRLAQLALNEFWGESGKSQSLKEKISHFAQVNEIFLRAIATKDPQWASRSRFELALASLRLADDLAINSRSSAVPARTQDQLLLDADRLRKAAKTLFSQNLLSQNFKGDGTVEMWKAKSRLYLNDLSQNFEDTSVDEIWLKPLALHFDAPLRWAL